MNPILEQKLRDLISDAEHYGAPAVYTTLNLLLAAHLNGNHHQFAKHCCQFSPHGAIEMSVRVGDPDDFMTHLKSDEYRH